MALLTLSQAVQNQSVTILDSSQLLPTVDSTHVFPGVVLAASSEAAIPLPIDDKVGIIASYASTLGHQTYSATGGLVLTVSAGDGWRSDLGSFTVKMVEDSTASLRKQVILGPFESARFGASATSTARGTKIGDPYLLLSFTTSTELAGAAANSVQILPFVFPKVNYAT